MLDTMTQVERLRVISHSVENGQPLDDELGRWLVSSLHRYLDEHEPIDKAFDLRRPRGGLSRRFEEANRARDASLRKCADLIDADACPTAKARIIEQLSHRYAASAWRFDRDRDDMPDYYRGTVREFIWLAFKSGARMPIGRRQLRTILG